MQTLHRSRDRLVGERTALINQLRAILLERGMVAPQGKRKLEQSLSVLMDEQGGAGLSPRMIVLVADARAQWAELNRRIPAFDAEFVRWAKEKEEARRLTTIPGVGAIVAPPCRRRRPGRGSERGRDLAAWLGLVPRQFTTGGKPSCLGSASAATITCAKRLPGPIHLPLFIPAAHDGAGIRRPIWPSPLDGRHEALKGLGVRYQQVATDRRREAGGRKVGETCHGLPCSGSEVGLDRARPRATNTEYRRSDDPKRSSSQSAFRRWEGVSGVHVMNRLLRFTPPPNLYQSDNLRMTLAGKSGPSPAAPRAMRRMASVTDRLWLSQKARKACASGSLSRNREIPTFARSRRFRQPSRQPLQRPVCAANCRTRPLPARRAHSRGNLYHKFPILPIRNNSRPITLSKTAHPLVSPTDCDAAKPRPLPVMIGSRVILLQVAVWGVLEIVLVQADLTDVRPFGRFAAHKNGAGNRLEGTSRFPAGVLTMAEDSPLVIVRSSNRLQQGFARAVSSPASPTAERRVGWPQAASPDLPWSIG